MTLELEHTQVAVDGGSLHVVSAGDPEAPPFVLLHGWPESWSTWRSLMEVAAPTARLVAIDLPGVGGSTPSTGGSKRRLAGIIHQLVETLGRRDVTLVGHDAGGMVAYAYLRRHLDVAQVVILNTFIPGVDPWDEVLANPYIWHVGFHSIPDLPETMVRGREGPYFDYFYDILSADPTRITPEARAAHVAAYGSDAALRAGFDFYRAFPEDVKDNHHAAEGEPAATPLLYVRGDRSRGNIEEYATGFRRAGVADLTTGIVTDAGHFLQEEQPAAVWRLVHDFRESRVQA